MDKTTRIKELQAKRYDPRALITGAHGLGVGTLRELEDMTGPQLLEAIADYEVAHPGDRVEDFMPAHTTIVKSATETGAHKPADTPPIHDEHVDTGKPWYKQRLRDRKRS